MTEHPAIARYMSRFEGTLKNYDLKEWSEIAIDLRSHINEAIGYGKPVDAVLEGLGPADTLARAYAVELLMQPPGDPRAKAATRFLKVAGLLIAGSFVTLIVATTLGSIGVSFILSGIVLIVIGGFEAAGVHLPHVRMGPLHPWGVIAIGPLMLVFGWGACWTLWAYLRFLARAVRKALPGRAKAGV